MHPIWSINEIMANKRKSLPPYLQRSLAVLIIFLMGISIARLLVSMHQQEERIEILEEYVDQLLADTSRLQIPQYALQSHGDNRYNSERRQASHNYHQRRQQSGHRPRQTQDADSDTVSMPGQQTSTHASMADATTHTHATRPATQDVATPATHKFTTPHLFDLNTIDSLTLIRIPGIASRTASVIIRYRMRYGGFHSPWQLQEFLTWDAAQDYMDEWCTQWFTADASRIRTIDVNKASISDLQRHPYISHEQAVEITRYRTRHKRISTITEMQQLTTFSPEQLQQILPYLSFEQ